MFTDLRARECHSENKEDYNDGIDMNTAETQYNLEVGRLGMKSFGIG